MIVLKEFDCNLSLDARGVLGTMVNLPECDYCTFEELCKSSPVTSKYNIKQALNELINKDFVLKITDKYAINKNAILGMKLI